MAEKSTDSLVEELATKLVEADPNNLQDLANLQTCFQRVSEEASQLKLEVVAAAASAAADLAKGIIMEEVPDRDAAFDLLSETVTSIQAVVRDGRKEEEVAFPEGLGLCNEEAHEEVKKKSVSLPPNVDEEIFGEFLAQQDTSLQEMEAHILLIEREKDQEALAALRRQIHTLKGEAGVLGLTGVGSLCHAIEDCIDAAGTELPIDKLLLVKDWLARTFKSFEGKQSPPEPVEQLIAQLSTAAPGMEGEEKQGDDDDAASEEKVKDVSISGDPELIAEFITEAEEHLNSLDVQLLTLETDPENSEVLNAIFRVFHTIKGAAGFLLLEDIAKLAHNSESLLDKARKKELLMEGDAIDVIFEAVDTTKLLIGRVKESLSSGETFAVDDSFNKLLSAIDDISEGRTATASPVPNKTKLGEILIERGVTTEDTVKAVLETQKEAEPPRPKVGELLVKEGIAAKEVAHALRSQREEALPKVKVTVKETMRVDADRLDHLVDTIGEMVIISSMIIQDQEIRDGASNRLVRNLSQMDKITRELQDLGLSLRMVTIKPTFQKMARMVRDLAKKAEKKVEFSMSGEETELDKSVVDAIGDPLIHMVRNSVDHGIEDSTEERLNTGKSEAGKISLQAFHKGGNVYIQIKDDGRGLNKEALLAKARERGLVKEDQSLSDHEIYNLIFAPGFSTAKKVTDVSGRGVGMDVVRRNVESLRGSVEIDSIPGKGSTFSLRLPLTLAIIDGMVVKAAEEIYIIPTISIVESLRPREDDITTVFEKGELIKVRGELIPLFRVSSLFDIKGAREDPTKASVVVVEEEGKQTGLLVDDLVGQQSTVIKSLGAGMQGIAGISGGTIMADGRVGIILDVAGIVKIATNNTKSKDSVSRARQQRVEGMQHMT